MADRATPTERLIRPRHGVTAIDFAELWRYRELFLFMAWRDILIRYKQTAVGVLWAVIQPVLMMVVFTVIFGKVAGLSSQGAPYAVMTFSALLPWQFFANAVQFGSQSLVTSANMIRKVYFPRLIAPASSTLSGSLDFAVSFGVLLCLMAYYSTPFRVHLLLLPGFFLMGAATALAASLWLSALNVKYRDVKYVVPFIVRMGLYISPVGFATAEIPERWRFWYCLNPMVGVIDGFRWAIIGPAFEPYWAGFWPSVGLLVVLLITGAFFFRTTEKTFADLI